jgi:GxxExxY protein
MEGSQLYQDLASKIRRCLLNVYNKLGYGHEEFVYSNALSIEFDNFDIRYEKDKQLSVIYDIQKIGYYQPDFVVDSSIIIEIESLDKLPEVLEKQLEYNLKSTDFKLGFLVNFGGENLVIKEVFWDKKL